MWQSETKGGESMRTKLLVAAAFLAMGLSGAVAGPAPAGVKNIYPHQLRPFSAQISVADNESRAVNGFWMVKTTSSAGAAFAAQVKLKPGSRITRFSVLAESPSSGTALFYLYRTREGVLETIAEIEKAGESYSKSWFHDDTISFPLVRKGDIFWVRVFIGSTSPIFYQSKVRYQ